MIIAVDFDGTCVTHDYPEIGEDIGAVSVLKDIVKNGHKLILFTMRSGNELEDAKKWFEKHNIPLFGVNKNPTQHTWTSSVKPYAHMYIDDAALGVPLMVDMGLSARPFVNWHKVGELLVHLGVINKKINITHQNREGQNIWFEKVGENLYTIDSTSDYALQYSTINYDALPNDAEEYDFCWECGTKGNIHSFDPSGGPFISVGNYEIEGKKVSRIFYENKQIHFETEL